MEKGLYSLPEVHVIYDQLWLTCIKARRYADRKGDGPIGIVTMREAFIKDLRFFLKYP